MNRQQVQASPVDLNGFTYDALDASAAAIAKDAANVIRGVHRQGTRVIGEHLLRAKAALPHGAFTAWLRDVLAMQPTTAGNYMRAAALLDGKPATVADLPPTVLYALASPAAPAAVVQEVMADAATGVALDPHAIRAKLDAAAQEQRELKVAQKRSPNLTTAELRARRQRDTERCAAKEARAKAKDEQEQAERLQRLAPLVTLVTTPGAAPAADLLAVLDHWQDLQAFTVLLREAVQ